VVVELVLMGVEGSGKSTVGPRVATALDVPYFDADNFHSADAIARMSAGIPLDDTERHPWLERLHAVLVEHDASGAVLACSALKPSYRAVLARGLPTVRFVALVVPPDVLEARLAHRHGHYAGPDLLASQLATFELDADVSVVDGNRPVDEVVAEVLDAVRR
jgi:gluconokinase